MMDFNDRDELVETMTLKDGSVLDVQTNADGERVVRFYGNGTASFS